MGLKERSLAMAEFKRPHAEAQSRREKRMPASVSSVLSVAKLP